VNYRYLSVVVAN